MPSVKRNMYKYVFLLFKSKCKYKLSINDIVKVIMAKLCDRNKAIF